MTRCLRMGVLLAASLSLLSVARAQNPPAARAATLRSQSGEVLIRRATGDAAPAAAGPLFRRDEIESHAGTAAIELGTGMLIELGPDSLFAVIGGSGNVDGFLARGTLHVRAPGELRTVQIATPAGRIDLRSKDATVGISADLTLVQVLDGSADFSGREKRVTARAGQELEARAGLVITQPRAITAAVAVPAPTEAPPAQASAQGNATPDSVPAAIQTPAQQPPPAPFAQQQQQQPPAPAPRPPFLTRLKGMLPPAAPSVPAGAPDTSPQPATVQGPQPQPIVLAPLAVPAPNVTPPQPPAGAQAVAPAAPAAPIVAPATAPVATKEPFFGFTSLRILREKGLISEAEFASAQRDLHEAVGPHGVDSTTLVVGKWATTLYGFIQADVMWHSTQSFNDYGSNFPVARPGTFAGEHGRVQASVRDSRVGFRLAAPEIRWFRASAVLEMDFIGPTGTIPTTITETSFFENPNLRIRHAYFKVETPIVDILIGHYWHLFGWQPNYFPAIVTWPGLVGELFSRTTQLRLSKTIKSKPVNLEMALAGMRPPQRDSMVPELQAGLRLSFNKWAAVHTGYMTATSTMPASIAIAGDFRSFALPELSATPKETNRKYGFGVSVNAFLPIVRATKERKDNSLAIIGEFVTGQGINDMYTGLNGGVSNPPLGAAPGMTPPAFVPGIDPGLAVYDQSGELQMPRWTTFLVGAEYYLPKVGGRIGVFANFSHSQLHDSQIYGNAGKVRDNETFYNAGVFGDFTDAIRVGVDYSRFDDQYADGVHAINDSVQAVGFFFF